MNCCRYSYTHNFSFSLAIPNAKRIRMNHVKFTGLGKDTVIMTVNVGKFSRHTNCAFCNEKYGSPSSVPDVYARWNRIVTTEVDSRLVCVYTGSDEEMCMFLVCSNCRQSVRDGIDGGQFTCYNLLLKFPDDCTLYEYESIQEY